MWIPLNLCESMWIYESMWIPWNLCESTWINESMWIHESMWIYESMWIHDSMRIHESMWIHDSIWIHVKQFPNHARFTPDMIFHVSVSIGSFVLRVTPNDSTCCHETYLYCMTWPATGLSNSDRHSDVRKLRIGCVCILCNLPINSENKSENIQATIAVISVDNRVTSKLVFKMFAACRRNKVDSYSCNIL